MADDQKSEIVVVSGALPATPMEMLSRALERGADMAVLEKLMGLQERWEANNARKAFDAAIAQAKASISPIARNATGHNSKKYADFAAIAREVDPILAANGLSYRFKTRQDDRIHVTCVLAHRDGHSEETTLSGPADNSGNKNAIQSIGSTLTYLQRYSLTQMLGLASSNDDDGKAGGAGVTITPEQVDALQRAIVDADADIPKFLAYFKVERLDDMPAKDFSRALDAIKRSAAKRSAQQ